MLITGKTRVLAVIGYPIGHSLSPMMHNAAIEALGLDYIYVPFKVHPDSIAMTAQSFRALNIAGVNATIPHKEIIIPHLDSISETARLTGSANTIVNNDGKLHGDSTDGTGFMQAAESELGAIAGCKVLVIGAGGSARAICVALRQAGCDVYLTNRTMARASSLADILTGIPAQGTVELVRADTDEFADIVDACDLIVNTTSVGMTPNVNDTPLCADLIKPHHRVYDIIYSPFETRLVKEARSRGASAVTGLGMLIYQGAASFELWTGIYPPVDVMKSALLEYLSQH